MSKKQYGNVQATSGVTHYTVHPEGLTVYFGHKSYHYNHDSAGKEHVESMKRLAASGIGLASYISAHRPGHAK